MKFYGKRETTSIYFSGGCSATFYGDPLFPEAVHGNLFYCEPSLNIVHRCLLHRDGAGYRAERAPEERQSEFLASTDQWFRPMGLRVGPEGSLYIVDMYREIIEDYSAIPRFLQQQYGLNKGKAHGRIWRLHPENAGPAGHHSLAGRSNAELVPMLDHANAWYRRTAQRLLIERKATDVVPLLEQLTLSDKTLKKTRTSPEGLLHTLHTLEGLRSLQNRDPERLLSHEDYRVRVHALRLIKPGGRTRSSHRQLAARIVNMAIDDPDPSVRHQAVFTVGALRDPFFIRMLTAVASGENREDSWLMAAILSVCNQQGAPGLLRKALHESVS
ncbi:MAG: hypothetical protein AAF492_33565, partial [Verrucomicrobiota bacterium]